MEILQHGIHFQGHEYIASELNVQVRRKALRSQVTNWRAVEAEPNNRAIKQDLLERDKC